MRTYRVRASRWAEGWELDIVGVGVTQCTTLTTAEHTVRSYLRLDGRRDADSSRIELEYTGDLGHQVASVQSLRSHAMEANNDAAEATRGLARQLVGEGCSGAEVAVLLGITPQRVSQLLAAKERPRRSA